MESFSQKRSSLNEVIDHDWSSNHLGRHFQLPFSMSRDTVEYSRLDSTEHQPVMETKLYKRRWVMLLIFSAYSMSNAFMWLQYGVINNIFMHFYNVDSEAINLLSMVYFFSYIPLILPVIWMLDKRGLRDILVVGAAFNCIGAWIKTSTADPQMFVVTLFGQFVCSVATVFVLGIPSRLASLWFGQHEVSTASSVGVLGNQVCLTNKYFTKCVFFSCALMVCIEVVKKLWGKKLICIFKNICNVRYNQ